MCVHGSIWNSENKSGIHFIGAYFHVVFGDGEGEVVGDGRGGNEGEVVGDGRGGFVGEVVGDGRGGEGGFVPYSS